MTTTMTMKMIMFGMTTADRKWKCLQDRRRCSVKSPVATDMRWYRNAVSRGSHVLKVILLPISVIKRWASSANGPRDSTAAGIKIWLDDKPLYLADFLSMQRSPLPFRPEPHFVPHKKQPACGQQSRPMWRCVLNATVPKSEHRAFFRHLCWDLVAPWMMVFQL